MFCSTKKLKHLNNHNSKNHNGKSSDHFLEHLVKIDFQPHCIIFVFQPLPKKPHKTMYIIHPHPQPSSLSRSPSAPAALGHKLAAAPSTAPITPPSEITQRLYDSLQASPRKKTPTPPRQFTAAASTWPASAPSTGDYGVLHVSARGQSSRWTRSIR